VSAAQHLLALGTDVTADVLPFVGHDVPDTMAALVIERLRGYLPQRHWREAMQSAAKLDSSGGV
jgi:phospholipase/carboxylesterase